MEQQRIGAFLARLGVAILAVHFGTGIGIILNSFDPVWFKTSAPFTGSPSEIVLGVISCFSPLYVVFALALAGFAAVGAVVAEGVGAICLAAFVCGKNDWRLVVLSAVICAGIGVYAGHVFPPHT